MQPWPRSWDIDVGPGTEAPFCVLQAMGEVIVPGLTPWQQETKLQSE